MRSSILQYCFVALLSASMVVACGDDDTTSPGTAPIPAGCFDLDGDGQLGLTLDCPSGRDCLDNDPAIYEGAPEICGDGINQACSPGGADLGCACDADADSDGFKIKSEECPDGTDCDDGDASIKPTSPEIPGDGIDNNCDDEIDNTACQPSCNGGKVCGDDGCGGSCGECPEGSTCFSGQCEQGVEPGGDTCLGKCGGAYDPNASCQCDQNCGKVGDCCDDFCDNCSALYPQACECVPNCVTDDGAAKECGGDGCGGVCGTCPEGSACDAQGSCGCTDEATTSCGADGNVYWYDSCGNQGELKTDCADAGCSGGLCTGCEPSCAEGQQCGDDGCGGSCGECGGGASCVEGLCEIATLPGSCEGRCGDYDDALECQCDSGCFTFGDCCEDVCDACSTDFEDKCGCSDEDGDGFGEGPACKGPDCDDTDKSVNPDSAEIPGNGKDDDCVDGDEEAEPVECTEELDADGDGYCPPQDCDDANADINPGETDVCEDGINQDCSEDGDAICPEIDCIDADGDLYGEGADCLGSDCNDQDPTINTSIEAKQNEICGDGIDQDCDLVDPECPETCVDEDEDGFYAIADDCEEGTDCDDNDATSNPDAEDICDDGINQDCSEDGLDEICVVSEGCEQDGDCQAGTWCNLSAEIGVCEAPKYWDYWAPVVYLDTSSVDSKLGWDFFTDVEFDGDEIAGNNGDHVNSYDKPAISYYSYVKTETHAYITYNFYFPWRWSDAIFGGTQYENVMRSVLLVIRLDEGNSMGTLELMETTTENSFYRYVPADSELAGLVDGEIAFDNSSGHDRPIINIYAKSHNIYNGHNWQNNGFPEDNGWVMKWGWQAGTPQVNTGVASYALKELKSSLWAKRNQVGPINQLFDAFGRFAGDDNDTNRSNAPWRYNDQMLGAGKPWGEILYDPASLVRRQYPNWDGEFSYQYTYNPYAVEVTMVDLYIYDGNGDFEGFGAGDPDVYVNLYMRDGKGTEHKVLGEKAGDGLQNNWKQDETELPVSLLMSAAMGRNFFYGMDHPDHTYYGFEIREADVSFDDWIMDPAERFYGSHTGSQLLDFGYSDSIVKVKNGNF